MASNMDREMILADFQVKCLTLLASHLQLAASGWLARWPLPCVCLSTAVVVVCAFLPYVAQDVCIL